MCSCGLVHHQSHCLLEQYRNNLCCCAVCFLEVLTWEIAEWVRLSAFLIRSKHTPTAGQTRRKKQQPRIHNHAQTRTDVHSLEIYKYTIFGYLPKYYTFSILPVKQSSLSSNWVMFWWECQLHRGMMCSLLLTAVFQHSHIICTYVSYVSWGAALCHSQLKPIINTLGLMRPRPAP